MKGFNSSIGHIVPPINQLGYGFYSVSARREMEGLPADVNAGTACGIIRFPYYGGIVSLVFYIDESGYNAPFIYSRRGDEHPWTKLV